MTIEQDGYLLTGSVEENQKQESHQIAIWFDYIVDETSSVEADITDNWVESNYSLQDHIAIKPQVYRLRGCVGEVIFENQWKLLNTADFFIQQHPVLQKTLEGVNAISSLSGIVSNYTRAAINVAKQLESSFDRYKKIWQNFRKQNMFVNKRQKAIYAILTTLLQTRKPVKLKGLMFSLDEALYNFSDNDYDKLYFIQSVSAHQTDSEYISDIEVVIKEFRIAQTRTTKVDKNKFGGIVADQKTEEANNGPAKGNTIQNIAKTMQNIAKRVQSDEPPKNPIKKFAWQILKKSSEYRPISDPRFQ